MQSRIKGSYIFSNVLFTGLELSGLNLPLIKKDISTGANVITSTASTIKIKVFVYARGPNNFPSCPVNKKTGKKEAMMIIVEKNTPLDTCLHERSMIPNRTCSGILL